MNTFDGRRQIKKKIFLALGYGLLIGSVTYLMDLFGQEPMILVRILVYLGVGVVYFSVYGDK